jgi:histidyl-tRNA synthetase
MDITPTEFLKQATRTAEHFGFRNTDTFKRLPSCKDCTTKVTHTASAADRRADALHGLLTSGISAYTDERLHAIDEPVFYYNVTQVPRSGETAVTLQIFGVEKSIAETILIQTARALVSDLGFQNHSVRINSLGDRDSSARYVRELTNYLKKRLEDMPVSARELMKEHVLEALTYLIDKQHDLAYRSPSPLEYLSDSSRRHFREIVEYLDMSETPYEIDPKLIGNHHCYSDALFAIDLLDEQGMHDSQQPIYIRGGRYNTFMNRHLKREVPAAGAVVVLREKKAPQRTPRLARNPQPSVYVVQLGFGPKIRSLMLVDELRRAGVPTLHSLASDSLSNQLRDAEARGVRYTVIVGQKEYVENTVILRDMQERKQDIIPLEAITGRLKRARAHA